MDREAKRNREGENHKTRLKHERVSEICPGLREGSNAAEEDFAGPWDYSRSENNNVAIQM